MAKKTDYLRVWTDHPSNPLIEPPWPEFLLGDPTFLPADDGPDGSWHLFANTLIGIHHFTSPDGVQWHRLGKVFPGFRAFLFKQGELFYLFYERFTVPWVRSHIEYRTSMDLENWTSETVALRATLSWEGRYCRTAGNPCLARAGDRFRLFYSANVVFLRDLGFCEPRYIGVAESEKVTGPFEKLPEPIISPSEDDPHRNRGAGAIKVIYDDQRAIYWGFNNGIYSEENGRSRSAVMLMSSADGVSFEDVYPEPVIAPGGGGWKKALVYQLDVRKVGDEMWLYYNARSSWRFGRERIGLATTSV